ncbi:uncharacterized protein LOC135395842 [Ornithodoros turicata]|uniref:uncharacterized protein LOC135395842 n=1 Tax=Ornithodoros turicata TaxID=34597 RepID=UPI003139EF95
MALKQRRKGDTDIRGVIDGGSDRTFITESLATSLRLPIVDEISISIATFGDSEKTNPIKRKVANIQLRSQYDTQELIIQAVIIPAICHDIRSASPDVSFLRELREQGKNLADGLYFPGDRYHDGISILIGADKMWQVLTGEVLRKKGSRNLVALNSLLGWTIQGPTKVSSAVEFRQGTYLQQSAVACVLRVHSSVEYAISGEDETSWEPTLRSFWEIDSMAILPETGITDTSTVMENFSKTVKKTEDRYEVALPWKIDPSVVLNDNYDVAVTRLKKLVARLRRTDGLLLRYDGVIRDYLNLGHAEVVDESIEPKNLVYYMPHSAVIREDRATTKVRVVFDASSHAPDSISLNQCLDKGINLNPDILQLLLRFRSDKVALTADIEKTFLQVLIRKEDRDVFRYLWFQHQPDQEASHNDLDGVQVLRMTRVPFGATSSPFLLSATIQHHLATITGDQETTARKLSRSFYVDDLVTGADSEEEAEKLYREALEIMNTAGMNLRKWTTSNDRLRALFDGRESPVHGTKEKQQLLSPQKILGVSWDTEQDKLQVTMKSLFTFLLETADTKRYVLQAASRIFDPLGILSPFTIRVKKLFQQLWIHGVKWDDKLPEEALTEWKSWCAELLTLRLVKVCRYFGPLDSTTGRHLILYAFSDASMHAYGAVVYVKVAGQATTHSNIHLLVSKTRVSPLKSKLTLPRLELMGALVAARLVHYVRRALYDCTVALLGRLDHSSWMDSAGPISVEHIRSKQGC